MIFIKQVLDHYYQVINDHNGEKNEILGTWRDRDNAQIQLDYLVARENNKKKSK